MKKDRIPNYELYKAEFLAGVSLEKISKKYHTCAYKLGKALKEDGVVIVRNNQKHTYNTEFFKHIDTEEKAYWLGFLYADGYIGKRTTMELALAKADEKHLEAFRDCIAPKVPLEPREIKLKGKMFHAVRLSFTSKEIKDQLNSLGCLNKKSLTLQFNKNLLTSDLMRHFLRGYFDGDGCIYATGWVLSGNAKFLTAVQTYLLEHVSGYTQVEVRKDKRSNIYSVSKGTPRAALRFLHYIYQNATIYLERKYNKYIELSKHLPQRAEMLVSKSRKKSGRLKTLIRGEGLAKLAQPQRIGSEKI